MKNRSAKSSGKSVSPLPLRSVRPRESILRKPGAEKPQAAKLPARATAVRLAAEVERLAAELEASRARITELETRIDVDPLTETLNRRGFERELKRSLAYVKRYGASAALIYLDLDEFKPINDRHGHAAGDAVLKAIAAALARNVRASDVVARIGGDEFVVLLWNVDCGRRRSQSRRAGSGGLRDPGALGQLRRWSVGASAGHDVVGPLDRPPRCSPAPMPPCMRARQDGGTMISSAPLPALRVRR